MLSSQVTQVLLLEKHMEFELTMQNNEIHEDP